MPRRCGDTAPTNPTCVSKWNWSTCPPNSKDTDFAPFAETLSKGGEIKAIVVKGKADYSRKQTDELQEFVKRYGAGALAWIKVGDETTSSLLKVLGEAKIAELASTAGAEKGDAVLIVAGKKSVVAAALGALRNEVARRENLIDRSRYECLIVTEFPMFEHDDETDTYVAAHHPFTSPMDEDLELFKTAVNDPSQHHLLGQVRAKAYDAVINGYECAGGSIRIHQKEVQALNFKALGMTPETARCALRLFPRRPRIRHAPARRLRRRHRTYLYEPGRHRKHPRRHGLPENRLGTGPDDGLAG